MTEMQQPLSFLEYVDIKMCKLRVGGLNPLWNYDEQLAYWKRYSCIFLCLCRFINDLPYKSDESAHVAFPDECYNKPKLTTIRRDGVCDATHMHMMYMFFYCERSRTEMHVCNLHACE